MEFLEIINKKKEIYKKFIEFIEDSIVSDNSYHEFIKSIKVQQDHENLQEFLHLLNIISKNCHLNKNVSNKIEQILITLKENIKNTFSNSEIFEIFKGNKKILLFLHKNGIFLFDNSLINDIFNDKKLQSKNKFFIHFFFIEIQNLIDDTKRKKIESELLKIDSNIFNNFEEKRQIGENDSYISSLIRNDSVESFISYMNRKNYSLSSTIKSSIFETNSFLIEKEPTLIEYSAFFGSIQIFQYLKMNNVELTPSLWLYAIHSNCYDLIHILEENHIEPEDSSYEQCFKEANKCHHNDIAIYIYDNLLNVNTENLENNFDQRVISYCFHYHNFTFLPNNLSNKFILFYLCKYDYIDLVKILVKTKNTNLNNKMILNLFFFSHQINI